MAGAVKFVLGMNEESWIMKTVLRRNCMLKQTFIYRQCYIHCVSSASHEVVRSVGCTGWN